MRRAGVIVAVVLLACGASAAANFEKGNREVALGLSFTDVDFGSNAYGDFGSWRSTEFVLSYGWLVTDTVEVGGAISHSKNEVDGGDFGRDSESDATGFGVFFQNNFRTSGKFTPFVGIAFFALSGDVSDIYDYEINAEAGVKIYPFKHGGIVASAQYSRSFSGNDAYPDADALGLGVGLVLKY